MAKSWKSGPTCPALPYAVYQTSPAPTPTKLLAPLEQFNLHVVKNRQQSLLPCIYDRVKLTTCQNSQFGKRKESTSTQFPMCTPAEIGNLFFFFFKKMPWYKFIYGDAIRLPFIAWGWPTDISVNESLSLIGIKWGNKIAGERKNCNHASEKGSHWCWRKCYFLPPKWRLTSHSHISWMSEFFFHHL